MDTNCIAHTGALSELRLLHDPSQLHHRVYFKPCCRQLWALLDRGGQAGLACMGGAGVVLQAGQGSQHVVLGLEGGVAHAGAAAHAQLKLAKP